MLKFLIFPLLTLVMSLPVQAQSIPNLSIRDRQRIIRDLTPTPSQDFFNEGRVQLEREIRLLERRFMTEKEPILRVDSIPQDQTDQPLNPSRKPDQKHHN